MPVDADVCVVGAGYAGLSAARRLVGEGRSVVVLEARDRVGGRVWTKEYAGTHVDLGGTFIGPDQSVLRDLAREFGVKLVPTFHTGDSVLVHDGKTHRYHGLIPPINPIAIANLGLNMARIDRMAKRVPLDAPWTARKAQAWDAKSAGSWNAANAPVPAARALLDATVRGLMSCDPSEVSLLHLLYLVHSAGGLNNLLSVEGGYQQDQVEGGAQTMANLMAGELGDAVRLRAPVRKVTQDATGVRVAADGVDVVAPHVVMTIPPGLAADIEYEPALPQHRELLMRRSAGGSVFKTNVFYSEPFWRSDGLCGESVSTDPPIELTLDVSPASGSPGVIVCFAFGPYSRAFTTTDPGERRRVVLDTLRDRYGAPALDPIDYHEQEWASEEWTRGCSMSYLPPGALTQYGRTVRTPCGRVHWAGTETATRFHGTIDGAIRSGVRAADEVLART